MFRMTRLASAMAAASLTAIPAYAQTNNELEPVIVTATRTAQTMDETLASVSVITRQTIEASGAQSIDEILRTQTGIHITRAGGMGNTTGIHLRGTNSGHVLILIDGVRAGLAASGTPAWGEIPVEQIEKIEIVRGPKSSIYGSDSIGGVIQIFTRKNRGSHGSIEYGSNNTKRYSAGTGKKLENIEYSLTFAKTETDGIPILISENTDQGFENQSLSFQLDSVLENQFELRVDANFHEGTREDTASRGRNDFRQHIFSINAEKPVTENTSAKLQASYFLDENQSFSISSPTIITTERNSIGTSIAHNLSNIGLTAGIDHWQDHITKDLTGDLNKKLDNTGIYGTANIEAAGFNSELSLRHDWFDQLAEETTWQISLGKKLSEQLSGSVSTGTAFKTPASNDLYYPTYNYYYDNSYNYYSTIAACSAAAGAANCTWDTGAGSENLSPEKSKGIEAILKYSMDDNHSIQLSAYKNKIENLIQWSTAVDTSNTYTKYTLSPSNSGKATIQGIEISLANKLGSWNTTQSLNVMSAKDDDSGYQLIRRPIRTYTSSIEGPLMGGSLFADAVWVSSRYDYLVGETPQVELDGYFLLNAKWKTKLNKQTNFHIRAENLLDENYATMSYFGLSNYSTPGLSLFTGLDFSF
jgi:vitamin B12 transporter